MRLEIAYMPVGANARTIISVRLAQADVAGVDAKVVLQQGQV